MTAKQIQEHLERIRARLDESPAYSGVVEPPNAAFGTVIYDIITLLDIIYLQGQELEELRKTEINDIDFHIKYYRGLVNFINNISKDSILK